MALGLPSNILILVVSYMTLHKNPSSSCLLVNMAIAGIFISINISIKLKNELNENTNWVSVNPKLTHWILYTLDATFRWVTSDGAHFCASITTGLMKCA